MEKQTPRQPEARAEWIQFIPFSWLHGDVGVIPMAQKYLPREVVDSILATPYKPVEGGDRGFFCTAQFILWVNLYMNKLNK